MKILGAESELLTLHFFSDLISIQNEKVASGRKDLGELLVAAAYNKEKAELEVHVIQGKGLPVMDKSGEGSLQI